MRTRRENRQVSVTVASGLLTLDMRLPDPGPRSLVRGDQAACHTLVWQGEQTVGGSDARARR